MLSYTERRNLAGDLSNNSASATLTLFDKLISLEEKRILSSYAWPFLEKQFSMTCGDIVTVTIASPAVFTCTTNNFSVNDVVYFTTTGALPTGLSAGTRYYVIATGLGGNDFRVSATLGGTVVDTSGSQSGTHSVTPAFKTLPQYIDRVSSLYVTVGTYNYTPRECPSREQWDRLNMTTVTSDIPTWWYVYNGKLGLFPRPSTASNIITINSKQLARDLTVADYTTGNILTAVNGSATITGTGTTFTQSMVGRWLRITESDTANKGDGYWYRILSYTSATVITLEKPYQGTAITTGTAAYTISQCSLVPEQYQDLPIYGALRTYFTSVAPDNSKAQLYGGMYKELMQTMEADFSVKNQSCVIDDGTGYDYQQENPNLFITL
jgi:hypothetical protein